jgi:hypothetical protein
LAGEINVWWNSVVEGAKRLGYDWEKANGYTALLREKGFKNVRCKRETWQIGVWNSEPSKKITRLYLLELLAAGLASLSLVPLIEGMGYTYGESQRKIEDVKKALRDRNTLASIDTYVIPYPIILIFIRSQSKKNCDLWSQIEHPYWMPAALSCLYIVGININSINFHIQSICCIVHPYHNSSQPRLTLI